MLGTPPVRGAYRTDGRARAAYAEGAGIYRIVPAAVCLPQDVEDLRRLVQWAGDTGTRLVPRGAGSAMGGGNVGEGVVVDLNALEPKVLELDPEARTATTSASITLGELNQAAARLGLRLPPDPSSGAWATLGGMVSTNAAGARSVRYGSVRRWVEAIELVTADAESGWMRRGGATDALGAAVRFEREVASRIRAAAPAIRTRFPATRKNASGYAVDAYLGSGDSLDLLVGAEGTLGVITRIGWRLDPIPRTRAALRISLASLEDLGPVVPALTALDPSALELLDRSFLDLVSSSSRAALIPEYPSAAQAILVVEFEGGDPATVRGTVGDAVRAVGPWALEVETALTPEQEQRLWALRHAASPILASLPEDRRSMQVIEDGCVPVGRLAEYIRFIRQAAEARGLTVVIYGHAGDGNVHVNLLPELARTDWPAQVAGLYQEVSDEVIRLGGTPSGEHGDGRLRAGLLERLYGHELVQLFRQVKTAFDPRGIFNPGVILDAGDPPLARLKSGPGAPDIPLDIARALRDLERRGGYARPRLEIADERQG